MTLTVKDLLSFDTLGDVNLRAHLTLRTKNLRSFNSLGFCLEFHTSFNLFWGLDVFDFVSHAIDSPFLTRLVQTHFDARI